jgi:hypothetical protein
MTTLIPKYDLDVTGSINRPFNQKLDDYVSVKDFGAVGNGIANDTLAVQAAVDYCVANTKTLYLPDGLYMVGPINLNGTGTVITPGVQATGLQGIVGTGRGYGVCGFGAIVSGLWATTAMLTGNNLVNFEYSGFSLYGNGEADFGIDLSWDDVNSTVGIIENIFIEGCNLISLNLNNVYDTRISGIWLRDSTDVALTADCQQGMFIADNVQVVNGIVQIACQNGGVSHSMFADGLELGGASFNNMSFDTVHFYANTSTGIHVNSTATGNATRGLVFSGCYFNPCTYTMSGRYWQGATFIGCQFESAYTQILDPAIDPAAGAGVLPTFAFRHCSFQSTAPAAVASHFKVATEYCRDSSGVVGNVTVPVLTASVLVAGAYINNGDTTWTTNTGSPEGVVTAPIGSLYSRLDGGVSTTLYVKTSGTGNTGWTAK